MTSQLPLLEESTPDLPSGFRYEPALLTPSEQVSLLAQIAPLPFKEFEFYGFLGKRRVVSFGWKYDFSSQRARPTEPMPGFLLPLRDRAARFGGLEPSTLQQVLLTEYSPGAAIGWHKDKNVFDEVVGVSLGSSATFRFRRQSPDGKWERRSLTLAPGSAYLIAGESRTHWEHSIPSVDALRYSVTFRSMR
jgi:alkylated DNA repair dioxygenase AlkB